MRRLWQVALLLLCAVGACVVALPQTAEAQTYGGTSGTVSWTLDTDTGELHLKPTSGDEGTLADNTNDVGTFMQFWPWYMDRSSVRSVTMEGTIHTSKGAAGMFWGCSNVTSIDLSHLDTSQAEDLGSLFNGCSSLATLDVSHLDTSSATSLVSMFQNCSSLTTLDVTGWDTSKVQRMGSVFSWCQSLTGIKGINGWDTSSATLMGSMFRSCSSLKSLDLSKWDTSHVTDFNGTFIRCSALKTLDIEGWDTSQATTMKNMFAYDTILESVTLGRKFTFKGNGITNKPDMAMLPSPDGYNGDTVRWTNGRRTMTRANLRDNYKPGMAGTWTRIRNEIASGTSGTVSWTLYDDGELHFAPTDGQEGTFDSSTNSNFDFWPWYQYRSSVTSVTSEGTIHGSQGMCGMFEGCYRLVDVSDLAFWDTSAVTDMSRMFYYCPMLSTTAPFASWNTSKVTTMAAMFYSCAFTNVDGLANWDVSHVTEFGNSDASNPNGMFAWCGNLSDISGLANWNVGNATIMECMFEDCRSLTDLTPLRSWDTSKVSDCWGMFYEDPAISVVAVGPATGQSVIGEFPTPPSDSPYTGKWIRTDGKGPYTVSELSQLTGADRLGTYVWEGSRTYSVEFDPNGGSGSMDGQVMMLDASANTLRGCHFANPGHTFVEWNTRPDGAGHSYAPGTISGAVYDEATQADAAMDSTVTLYAIWEDASYTVSFDPNGGSGSMSSIKAASVTVPSSAFARVGFRFSSWNTEPDGTGTSYAVGASLTPTEDMTLYAIWQAMPTTASYSNGLDVTLHAGEQVTIDGLPAGATYVVTETPVPAGWTLVRSEATTGVIVPSVG